MRVRGRSDDGQVVRWSGACQVYVKSQSELDDGGRETCSPSERVEFQDRQENYLLI